MYGFISVVLILVTFMVMVYVGAHFRGAAANGNKVKYIEIDNKLNKY